MITFLTGLYRPGGKLMYFSWPGRTRDMFSISYPTFSFSVFFLDSGAAEGSFSVDTLLSPSFLSLASSAVALGFFSSSSSIFSAAVVVVVGLADGVGLETGVVLFFLFLCC